MSSEAAVRPDWDRLFDAAAAQEGLFTSKQATAAGYSPQLLAHYLATGRATRVQRGIYRLVHFPAGDHEELVAACLWSEAGVVSHVSALALHGLSDAMPSRTHLSLPMAWRRRRLRVPPDIELHFADVPDTDRTWFGAAPTTSARRTLVDCALAGLAPDQLRLAAQQALRRGIVDGRELTEVEQALAPFGGLGE
jgi:predicted transcriptional regulator of viral defense system